MAEFNLPKPFKFRDTKDRRDRVRYWLSADDVKALLIEGLNQHLYLGGEPGTHNRLTIDEVRFADGQVSIAVDTWTEKS